MTALDCAAGKKQHAQQQNKKSRISGIFVFAAEQGHDLHTFKVGVKA